MTVGLGDHAAAAWLWYKGDREKAVARYRAILRKRPADISGLYFVVRGLRRSGKDIEALSVTEEALEVEPDNFLALQQACCISAALGNHVEGRAFAKRALAVADHEGPYSKWGDRLMTAGFWLIRVVKGRHRLAEREIPSVAAARELAEWKDWANRYVEWCDKAAMGEVK